MSWNKVSDSFVVHCCCCCCFSTCNYSFSMHAFEVEHDVEHTHTHTLAKSRSERENTIKNIHKRTDSNSIQVFFRVLVWQFVCFAFEEGALWHNIAYVQQQQQHHQQPNDRVFMHRSSGRGMVWLRRNHNRAMAFDDTESRERLDLANVFSTFHNSRMVIDVCLRKHTQHTICTECSLQDRRRKHHVESEPTKQMPTTDTQKI